MGYTKQTIAGVSWYSLVKLIVLILALLKIMVTARLLEPAAFGVFSLVLIALGLTESITQTGVNTTILQSKQSINYFMNTAWVIAILRGFLIGGVMNLLGAGLRAWLNQPSLLLWVAIASTIPVIKGFINPSIIAWQKNLQFRRDSFFRLAVMTCEVIVTIILVWATKSIGGLIGGMILSAVFEVFLSWVLQPLRPKFQFSANRAEPIFQNMKWLSISATLDYLHENIDNLLIGKFFGTYNLGLYDRSYALTHKLYEFAKGVNQSTLPVYTKIVYQPKRFKAAIRKTVLSTSLIMIAGATFFWIMPATLVQVILGEQWLELVPLVGWLAAAAAIQGISSLGYTTFLATKKYWLLNSHLAITLLLVTLGLAFIASQFDLKTAVQVIFLSRVISFPIILYGWWHAWQQ